MQWRSLMKQREVVEGDWRGTMREEEKTLKNSILFPGNILKVIISLPTLINS